MGGFLYTLGFLFVFFAGAASVASYTEKVTGMFARTMVQIVGSGVVVVVAFFWPFFIAASLLGFLVNALGKLVLRYL